MRERFAPASALPAALRCSSCSSRSPAPASPSTSSTRTPPSAKGLLELALVGDLGDEAVAGQPAQRRGLGSPPHSWSIAPRRGSSAPWRAGASGWWSARSGSAALSRSGFWFRKIARSPNFARLLEQRREVGRGAAVVGLDLIEDRRQKGSRAARAARSPRPARGVEEVEDEQVRRAAGRGCRPSPGRRGRSGPCPSPRGPGRCSRSGRAASVIAEEERRRSTRLVTGVIASGARAAGSDRARSAARRSAGTAAPPPATPRR